MQKFGSLHQNWFIRSAKPYFYFVDSGVINKDECISGTEFAKKLGCTLNGVKKMFGKVLSEGYSYLVEKNKIYIHEERAKIELRVATNPKTCKNVKRLEYLDMTEQQFVADNELSAPAGKIKNIDTLNSRELREEMLRSELRKSWIEEKVLEEKYVDRALVMANLEIIGAEIRDLVRGLPKRCVREVRLAPSEIEGENIMIKEIDDLLIELTEVYSKEIAPNDSSIEQ